MSKRFADFAKWIWEKRALGYDFLPPVLLEANPDQTLPRPGLSLSEAQSLFHFLEEQRLVFPKATQHGTAYSVNHVKEREWQEAIRELGKPAWRRSQNLARTLKYCGWTLSLIVAGFIGALARKAAEDFYDHWVQARTASKPKPDAVHFGRNPNSPPGEAGGGEAKK